jgi:hypothetical protein
MYAEDFVAWARVHHRSWRKDESRPSRVLPVFRDKKLDEITIAEIERFLAVLLEGEIADACLVMAGVDLLTVQKPGGWRTLSRWCSAMDILRPATCARQSSCSFPVTLLSN